MAKATKAALAGAGVVTTGVGAAAKVETTAAGGAADDDVATDSVVGALLVSEFAGPQAVSAARAPAAVMSRTVRRMEELPIRKTKRTGPYLFNPSVACTRWAVSRGASELHDTERLDSGQAVIEGADSPSSASIVFVQRRNVTVSQQNALKSARDYLTYSSLSHSGPVSQLEYDGFTPQQAEYGVSQTGL